MPPLIGLTPAYDEERQRFQLNADYMEAVRLAGGMPVVLPLVRDEQAAGALLARLDGLILTGGADVDPARYGQTPLPLCGPLCPARDEAELLLARRAAALGVPMLCICRGMQILNVAFGGTLYQDIAEQFGTQLTHPRSDRPREGVHTVSVLPGTRLAACAGEGALRVNSRHHQAVRDLAPGMTVNALASDGLIEGMEMRAPSLVLAVQWHPEGLAPHDARALALFETLVSYASERTPNCSGR